MGRVDFATEVRHVFLFMEEEYGFTLDPATTAEHVRYARAGVELDIGLARGDFWISFFVRLDDEVFRPYISRTFQLDEIVRRQDRAWLMPPEELRVELTSAEAVRAHLIWEARRLKRFCRPILEGDLALLQQIHLERRGCA